MLPELTPLLVVDDHEAEALMRSARADLAKLSLELRALQHEAASARSAYMTGEVDPTIDLDAARELLRTGVEARLAHRRSERRAEIERAERDAARRIADAEAEARALVDAARAQLLWAVDGTTSPPARLGPPAAPPSAPSAADDADWRLVTESVPEASAYPPPRPVSLAPPDAEPETAPVSLPPAVRAQPAGSPGRVRRSFHWRGLLHLDVLLPLIAVLIVAIVLLAWVG